MAAGGGKVYWKNWIRLRDAKKHTIKAFWWFKGDLISQWIPKFYLCDESNPINPQCRKISANFYISPPHPPHPQFYPRKWWKFRYTSWLTQNKANLRDLIAATGLVILLKLDLNRRFFSPYDLEIWWMTPKNNRAPLLCYFKLFASFRSHWWIQTGVTVRKRLIWAKIDVFLAVWPWNLMDDLQKQYGTSSMLL